MLNISISVSNNQVKNKIVCLTPKELYDTAGQMLISNQALVSVFNNIIRLYNCYGPGTHPSQSTIAGYCGISREWANKCIKVLCDIGFLIKKRIFIKGKETACLYSLPAIFQDLNVRYNLSSLLPALKWSYMPTFVRRLLSQAKSKLSQFTPYNSYYIKKEFKITKDKNNAIENLNTEKLSRKREVVMKKYNPTNTNEYDPVLSKQNHDRMTAQTNELLTGIAMKSQQARSVPPEQFKKELIERCKDRQIDDGAKMFLRILFENAA